MEVVFVSNCTYTSPYEVHVRLAVGRVEDSGRNSRHSDCHLGKSRRNKTVMTGGTAGGGGYRHVTYCRIAKSRPPDSNRRNSSLSPYISDFTLLFLEYTFYSPAVILNYRSTQQRTLVSQKTIPNPWP